MISDPQPWCPNGWAATESSPSCNYTGGHYCVRLPDATPLRQLDPDDGTVDWGGRSPLLHLKDAVAALLKEADQ